MTVIVATGCWEPGLSSGRRLVTHGKDRRRRGRQQRHSGEGRNLSRPDRFLPDIRGHRLLRLVEIWPGNRANGDRYDEVVGGTGSIGGDAIVNGTTQAKMNSESRPDRLPSRPQI
jgi:hypothetical protein